MAMDAVAMETNLTDTTSDVRTCMTGCMVRENDVQRCAASSNKQLTDRLDGGMVLTIVSKKFSNEIGAVGMQPAGTS